MSCFIWQIGWIISQVSSFTQIEGKHDITTWWLFVKGLKTKCFFKTSPIYIRIVSSTLGFGESVGISLICSKYQCFSLEKISWMMKAFKKSKLCIRVQTINGRMFGIHNNDNRQSPRLAWGVKFMICFEFLSLTQSYPACICVLWSINSLYGSVFKTRQRTNLWHFWLQSELVKGKYRLWR